MAIDMRDIASLARMMTRRSGKTTQRAYGTVVDVDTNGVTWVQLDGSDTATPTKGTTADVKVGDAVVVTVRGGRAFIEGSTSSPAVGRDAFQTAEERAKETRGTVDKLSEKLGTAMGDLTNATKIANEVKELAEVTVQYFWHRSDNPDGAGAGGFVTDVPREQYESAAANNFPDISANRQYYNFLMNTLGMTLRRAKTAIVSITHEAIAFYDGVANNAENVVAWFGRNGAQIGSSNNANITIDQTRISGVSSAGMKFLDMLFNRATETRQVESERTYCTSLDRVTITLDTSIWAVGEWPPPQDTRIDIYCIYDVGAAVSEFSSFWYGMPEQGTMTAIRFAYDGDMTVTVEPTMICAVYFKYEASFPTPSFSLGSGLANNAYAVSEGHSTYANGYASHAEGDRTVAGSSSAHAEGQSCKATGFCSHAEGMNSEATGGYAHAEGDGTKATNTFSHAEGSATQAVGYASHSEGSVTYANGAYSHSQNRGTYADGDSQTAIGKYNERDTSNTYALIVGNGQDSYNRSNAMTLDWDGNLDIAGKLSVADLSWEGNVNLVPTATANNQEWSIDLDPNGYTGTYWHVRTSAKSTILKCDTDTGRVTMPYEVYSNGRYNVKMGSIQRGVKPSATAYGNYEVKDANEKRLSITEFCCNTDGTNELRLLVLGNIASGDYYSGIIIRKAFENTDSRNMIYNANTGELETSGRLYLNRGGLRIRHDNLNRDGANPSAGTWGNAEITLCDVDGERIGSINSHRTTDGRQMLQITCTNENSSGSEIQNGLSLYLAKDGTATYGVSNAANFRSAIGAAASSDRRLKSDVSVLGEDAVAFIDALEPCVYTINCERQVGLIAQDVHEADTWGTRMAFETKEGIDGLDDWEKMEDGSPTWKLDYIRIIPPLVATVKSQAKRIEELEDRVSMLEKLVESVMKS